MSISERDFEKASRDSTRSSGDSAFRMVEKDKSISALSSPFAEDAFTHSIDDTASISLHSSDASSRSLQRSTASRLKPRSKQHFSSSFKLSFASLGLYGRESELQQLQRIFQLVATGAVQRQLILISGNSGTGKSALASCLKGIAKENKGLYVRGKFDVKERGEPYSGITSALAQICGYIESCQAENQAAYEVFCTSIREHLGSELSVLVQLVPALRELIDFTEQEPPPSLSERSSSSGETKNRLRFAFLRFIKLVTDQFAPLVFVLDDLQWSDPSSLDFFDALLTNREAADIIIVGTYRSNEVDASHMLNQSLEELRRKNMDALFEFLEIQIGNLNVDAVNSMIGGLLCVDTNKETKQLAEICLERTQGNAFFLRHFLSLLHDRNLLRFNPGLMGSGGAVGWTWNIDEIHAGTSISENVVDLLKNKMADLPSTLIVILKVAACLGSRFEERILKRVLESMSTELSIDVTIIDESIELLEENGYIRSISNFPSTVSGSKVLSWTHDKIVETALSLEEDEKEWVAFSSRVGKILSSQLDKRELDSMIFVAVNLLNQATKNTEEERVKVAALNYQATRKAVSLSAFETASVYAAYGINLLPENCWTNHYALSLGLFSAGAQTEGFLGNFETMERYCNHVLSIKNVPLEDKFVFYDTLIDGIKFQGRLKQAVELALDVAEKFGHRFPKNSVAVSVGVAKNVIGAMALSRRLLVGGLSEMNDRKKYQTQRLMDQLSQCMFLFRDKRLPLVICRSLSVTKNCGYSDYSSVSYVKVGMLIIAATGDLKGATLYGKHATYLMEKFPSPSSVPHSRALFMVNAYIFSWTNPLARLLKPMLLAYEANFRLGDSDHGFWAAYFWMLFRFIIGSNLSELEADYSFYSTKMKDLGKLQHLMMTKIMWQIVLNLMGCNKESLLEPIGEVFTEEDRASCRKSPVLSSNLERYHVILLTYFGDHLRQADIAIGIGSTLSKKHLHASPSAGIPYCTFLTAVSCFAAAYQTKDTKYLKKGEKIRSQIKKWRKRGNLNVIGYDLLLDAESAALMGKIKHAMQMYETAITYTSLNGRHLQDAAFACERYGEFHLNVTQNEEQAIYQIQQSVGFWKAWGAMGKVDHLERKYRDLLPQAPPMILAIN